MPYQFSHEYRDGIIEISVRGDEIDLELARRIAANVQEAVLRHPDSVGMMVDARGLRDRLSVADTFWHIRDYPILKRAMPTAVIDRPENAEWAQFHENAAVNCGFAIRFFTEPTEALTWLRTGHGSD